MKEIISEAALLVLLNAQMTYPLFKEDKTWLDVAPLPFYKEYNLVKAKTFSTIPAVEFKFLWSDKENNVIKINGDRDCFFDNIETLDPKINRQTAVHYVKFILGNVWDENGAMRVCQSIDDIEFSSDPTPEELAFLKENVKPATIVERDGIFIINCNIVYGITLYSATIELQHNGLFEIVDEQEIGEEIRALRTIFLA